jgi:putative zinc finger/helix-turn-helix YgiT family protein
MKEERYMEKDRVYCPICERDEEYTLKTNFIKEFKGFEVNVIEDVVICNECNEEIYVSEIESENFKRLYEKYRVLANVVKPEDIVHFRNKYNISQRELTSILNFGKMTLNRYERGAIPNSSHNDLLKLILSDNSFFNRKVQEAYENQRISEKTYNKIEAELRVSLKERIRNYIVDMLTHTQDEYNGYRKFDIDRLLNLIGYIAENTELYKTSLNKYLWYIDFANFKRNVRSITGLRYMKYTYGPIIEDFKYNDILEHFDEKFYKEEIEEGDKITVRIKSRGNYDLSLFSESEIHVIDEVLSVLKEKKSSEISAMSHREKGWIKNKDKDLISYEYADALKLI